MNEGSGLIETDVDPGLSSVAAPALLVELPSWRQNFRQNLRDTLRPQPEAPLRLASKPGEFWPDVFVRADLPWGKFAQSGTFHVAVFLALWGGSLLWAGRRQLTPQTVARNEDVIYYEPSEYLPPIDTGGSHAKQPQKGDPLPAPQPIISVPPEADNHTQTVVTPPNVKLNHDVPLPNVVSWPKTALSVPIAATQRSINSVAPSLNPSVVAPPPDMKLAASRQNMQMNQDVVAPPPQVDASIRRVSDVNIGRSTVVAPAPTLPMEAQRTVHADLGSSANAVVPPPPSFDGTGRAISGDRMIALGIHPAPVTGPVTAPEGNRRGSFAATPQGKAEATGMPDIAGDTQAKETGGGKGQGAAGAGSGKHNDIPSGLQVGEGPDPNHHSAIGGNGQGHGTGGVGDAQSHEPTLLAKVTPPRVSSTPERQAAEVSSNNPASEDEKKVFGDRKFYSLAVNVPNLNSAGGSWIIHFAELNPTEDKGGLTAPAASAMSDPAYPRELMNQHIQGTVTLSAEIGTDGSVTNVRVVHGVDERLDRYASEALARWHFHPATKNGNPIALQTVVMIPFRPGRVRSSF